MRCAVYVRVSTDKEEQKASLKYQKDLFYRYIEEKGWDFSEFYVDVQSGTTAKRKQLQKMIEDAEAKKFDIILAKELSRLEKMVNFHTRSKTFANLRASISSLWITRLIP
jgi:site-specific DNA recombinase